MVRVRLMLSNWFSKAFNELLPVSILILMFTRASRPYSFGLDIIFLEAIEVNGALISMATHCDGIQSKDLRSCPLISINENTLNDPKNFILTPSH